MASAGAGAYKGVWGKPPTGFRGQSSRWGQRGEAPLKLMSTHFCAGLELVVD